MITKKKSAPAKKQIVPKKTPAKNNKKEMIIAQSESCFWMHDGGPLYSLKDLRLELSRMNAEQYEYHTKRNGNDFSKWVAFVLCDSECAAELEKAKNQKTALAAIEKHLKKYDG